MLIRVEHATTFTYTDRITEAYTELRVRPLSSGGQQCTSFRLVTDPPGIRVSGATCAFTRERTS